MKPRKTSVILVKNEHLHIHKVEKSEKSCFRSSPKIVFLSFYLFKGGIFKRLGKPLSNRRKNVKISHLLRLPFLRSRIITQHILEKPQHYGSNIACSILWRPVLVKIMTIKLHHKSILIQLQQILWTCCVFLSSLNTTFFSVLVIIFSNKSYFCFNYTNTFFINAMNYFSVVLGVIFLKCIKNLFFSLQCIAGLHLKWTGSSLWLPRATNLKTLQVEEYFQRECQGETLSGKETKEVFIFLAYCQELVVWR